MKTSLFTLITATLFSLSSLAMPKVGDYALYFGTYEGSGGGVIEFEQSIEVMRIEQSRAILKSNLQIEDQNPTEEYFDIELDRLFSLEDLNIILKQCDSLGGNLEKITVPAGEFETCISKNETSSLWLAPVPFGIVKQIVIDDQENILTFTLKEYRFGN